MQYPVPQFTDVEDKIFGPLTLKQFIIVGAAGALIFVAYSSTKDILITVLLGLVLGLPAIALAFGKVNGRPLYNTIFSLLGYFFRPRYMLFHKEDEADIHLVRKEEVKKEEAPAVAQEAPAKRLKHLYYELEKNQAAEEKLAKQTNNK